MQAKRGFEDYGYQVVSSENGTILTMEDRHDAVGLACLLETTGVPYEYEVQAVPHTSEDELQSLTQDFPKGDH